METIEERAKKASEGYADDGYSAGLYTGYKEGATEQKEIDDAELGKALLYCTNKTTERVRKEMIYKACEWHKKYCGMNESGLVQFRKAMEES